MVDVDELISESIHITIVSYMAHSACCRQNAPRSLLSWHMGLLSIICAAPIAELLPSYKTDVQPLSCRCLIKFVSDDGVEKMRLPRNASSLSRSA